MAANQTVISGVLGVYGNHWFSVQAVACTDIISFPYTPSGPGLSGPKIDLNHRQIAHVRKRVHFRTSAGTAAITSAFLIEADQTFTAAACPVVAISGGSGHVAGPTALPLKADLQAEMSASPPISSASPPGADLPGDAPVRLVLTQSGSSTRPAMCFGKSCGGSMNCDQDPLRRRPRKSTAG